jgi:hypothetical protein
MRVIPDVLFALGLAFSLSIVPARVHGPDAAARAIFFLGEARSRREFTFVSPNCNTQPLFMAARRKHSVPVCFRAAQKGEVYPMRRLRK